MILLFTDFGAAGPYLGQIRAVLAQLAPTVPVVDMLSDAPQYNARASAYLLAAYAKSYPPGCTFFCVVDPGVGSDRAPAILTADGQHFVGPENGLLSQVAARAKQAQWSQIGWRPENGLSATFHGRDIFAPVAAWLATGQAERAAAITKPLQQILRSDWPEDLSEVCYIDHYGNAVTGLRADNLPLGCKLIANGHTLDRATTFSDYPPGSALWYENANGLAEIAVNQGRAENLGLSVGASVQITPSPSA